jgi:formylglycine-generating enzyme required for sulfatase activity
MAMTMAPLRTKKLFISYRSSDAAKVDKIARDLTLLMYDDGTPRYMTWQDKHNLPPASPNWWDAIVDAIEQCEMFVFNLSRASLQSEVCRAELEYAHKRNRPIIPVVLDGEFFLDPGSGKYDLPKETWALVPDWLGQAQFLFYVETQFYAKFQEAVAMFERSWPRDIPAPRPLNPDSKSVHGSNHALYSAACDYAERLAFTDAEKHFDALVRRNDEDYADLAAQWLTLIRRYAELIEIVEHRSPTVVFNRKWTTYQTLFPNDLVEGIFDPKNFAARVKTGNSGQSTVTTSKRRSADLLPAPFAWIEIPGGRGTMKTDASSVTLAIPTQRYWIAKYPVTNAQFAGFIEAGGYRERKWWTEDGWKQRESDQWTEPRYWNDSNWNSAEQPVVGVSWYEAVAFCLWLGEVTGEKIMLPTEAQWQYAAQGDDGRAYPWGNNWESSRCNNNVNNKGIGKTTPVRHYEGKGDSPFGVVDMAGNVWEWCLTDYQSRKEDISKSATIRVLRGGSWSLSYTDDFRCDYRNWYLPHYWYNPWGFRLSLS